MRLQEHLSHPSIVSDLVEGLLDSVLSLPFKYIQIYIFIRYIHVKSDICFFIFLCFVDHTRTQV